MLHKNINGFSIIAVRAGRRVGEVVILGAREHNRADFEYVWAYVPNVDVTEWGQGHYHFNLERCVDEWSKA